MKGFFAAAATTLALSGSALAQTLDLNQPTLVIGTAGGNEATTLFGAFSAVRLDDGRVVVANGGSKDVRIFDARGRHVRTFGREGSGPGEFRFLERAGRMRGDTIAVYDIGLGRISYFTPDGALSSSVQIQPFGNGVLPASVGFLDDGRMVARTDFGRVFGRGERRDTLTYVILARDGTPRDTLGSWPGLEEFHLADPNFSTRREVMFGRNAHAGAAGRYVVVGSSDRYALDIFLGERRLRTWSRPHTPARVSAADVRALNEEYLATVHDRVRQVVERRIDEFPARETHPAFTGVVVGRDGSLWIRRSTSPRTRTQLWDVYAQTSSEPVTVSLPRELTVLDAGDGWVLGRFRDAMGVEYIHVYDLPG